MSGRAEMPPAFDAFVRANAPGSRDLADHVIAYGRSDRDLDFDAYAESERVHKADPAACPVCHPTTEGAR